MTSETRPPAVPVTLRVAREEDAPVLASAEARTAATPGLLIARPGEIPVEAYRAKIASLRTSGRYLVAEADGVVVGHALLDPMAFAAVRHVFWLTVVVHPGYTGRGVGRQLLTALLAWASESDVVEKVELHVRATNERAIRLYRALGFVDEGLLRGRVKLPDGRLIDELTMAWFPKR